MKLLVIGGGGREHALAWKLARSPRVTEVLVAPGNAGTAREPGVRNVDIRADDLDALLACARDEVVDLTVVGPEGPLVAGIVDRFQAAGLAIFGPTAAAARLEGSKAFAKDFMHRYGIPTARYGSFTELDEALAYLRSMDLPIVVKADGLAAGKGVVLAATAAEAEAAVRDMLQGDAFGSAGQRVVIEEFLHGEEASFIALVGGGQLSALATSQDHKARDDGDHGPNTGGMGAYSPAPVINPTLHARILREVMEPTVRGLAHEGTPYTGFLYAGLMVGADGTPRVLEFNCRFGDPETQPVLFRLRSDLLDLITAALAGELDKTEADWDARAALGVVLAATGYPGPVRSGKPLGAIPDAAEDAKVFHAGTALDDGKVVTAGGRVLCAVALGATVTEAQARAYALVDRIDGTGMFCRRDIGHRAVSREQA